MTRIAYRKMGTAVSALKLSESGNFVGSNPPKAVSVETKQGQLYFVSIDFVKRNLEILGIGSSVNQILIHSSLDDI